MYGFQAKNLHILQSVVSILFDFLHNEQSRNKM